MTTEDAVVVALADAWPDLSAHFNRNHCIVAARVVLEVGRYFNVPVTVLATDAIITNAAARELINQGVPLDEWPDEAWSVGIHHAAPEGPGGYNGHVIAQTPRWHVDLSAPQFSRPKKGIVVDGPLVILRPADHDPAAPLVLANDAVELTYKPNGDTSFMNSHDWRTNYKPVAAEAIKHLRAVGVR